MRITVFFNYYVVKTFPSFLRENSTFNKKGPRPTNFPQALVWTFLALNFLLLSQIQLNLIFNNIIN